LTTPIDAEKAVSTQYLPDADVLASETRTRRRSRLPPCRSARTGQGVVMDIVLGIVGAVVGGWLFTTFGMAGVGGFNLYSLLVAVVGAALLLVVYRAISRGRR
jgi:uncharacterized membrane protein YeaQ/YmgE (transglycosylase-associated protein family)